MNIFVAKLNFKTKEESLRQLFEEFGEVSSVKIVTDHETGKSKGFGFVEMPNDDEAQNAIDELNESQFDNATIVVNKARPKEARPPRSNSGGGSGGWGDNKRRY
jgi:RNA recognition motif-containing protein